MRLGSIRRCFFVLFMVLFFVPILRAQNSITVSISVTDAGGQPWNNGTYTANFVGPASVNWPGGTVTRSFSGSLSASGTATQSLANNNTINPSPTFWTFTVCPAAGVSSGCFTTASISVTTPSQAVSITPPAISIPASSTNSPIGAYADAEITSNAFIGAVYTQIGNGTVVQRLCQAVSGTACTSWTVAGNSSQVSVPCSSSMTFTTGGSFVTDFFVNLTCNVTSSAMAGSPTTGSEAVFSLTQDATGGRTFAWPTNFLNTPPINTAINSTTVATFQFCGTAGNGNACPANSWQNTDVGPIGNSVGPVFNVTSNGASPSLADNSASFTTVAAAVSAASYIPVSSGNPTIRSSVATVMSSSAIASATATVNISAGDTVLVGMTAFNTGGALTYTVSDGTNTYYPVNLSTFPLDANVQVQVFGTVPGAAKAFSGTLTVTASPSAQFGFIVLDTFNVGSYGQTNLFNQSASTATPTTNVTTQDANNIVASWINFCNGAGVTISANTGTLQQSWNSTASICGAGLVTNTAASANTSVTTSASLSAGSHWSINGLELRSVTTVAPTVYFPAGRYTYSSGLNFTKAVTLKGEPGTVLCYTGTAHAIDFGAAVVQIDPYVIDGIRFECGAGMTEGIFLTNHTIYAQVRNSVFYNFGNTSASAIFSNGDSEDLRILNNQFIIFDGAPTALLTPSRSFVNATTSANFSTMIFKENFVICAQAKNGGGVGCGSTSGPMLTAQSYANIIEGNNVSGGFCPAFQLIGGGNSAAGTRVINNNIETDQTGCYGITLQTSLQNVKILGNFWSDKCSNPALCSLVGPSDATQVLTNMEVSNNSLVNIPTTTPVVTLNNLASQTGNIGWHNTCSTAQYSGTTPCALLHTTGGNISQWNPDRYPKLTFAAGTTASYTFSVTYAVAPVCTIPPNITGTATTLTLTTLSTTTLTITASASNSATVFAVCSEADAQ